MNYKSLFSLWVILLLACQKEPSISQPDRPFTLKVYDIAAVTATVEVEPLDPNASYYTDVLNESDFLQATEKGFDDYLAWFIDKLMEQTGEDRAGVLKRITSYGNDGFILTSLTPESVYYAVAVGIDTEGHTTTEVVSKRFSTTPYEVSENRFEVNFTTITPEIATLQVNTTNNDPYVLAIEPRSVTAEMDDKTLSEFIIQENLAWGGLEQMTYTGTCEYEHLGKAGWEYEVILFGYRNGSTTTAVKRVPFTMEQGADPATCTYSMHHEFDKLKIIFTVTPSENTVVYVCNYIKQSDLDSLIEACGNEQEALQETLNQLYEELLLDLGSPGRVVDIVTLMGEVEYEANFEANTTYRQWAVAVDQSGNPTAPFVLGEAFTTPDEVTSTATLTLKKYVWYNGTEAAERYPETFAGAKGYALVEIEVEPSEDAAQWWSYVAMEDLTDRLRRVIINNLISAPTEPSLTHQFIVAYWGVNTIMGVAQDAHGEYGPLMLQVVDLQKESAHPISELQL